MNNIVKIALIKIISILVSLKVWLLALATWLLLKGKISDDVWRDVLIGIALGRIVVQSILAAKRQLGSFDLRKSAENAKIDE